MNIEFRGGRAEAAANLYTIESCFTRGRWREAAGGYVVPDWHEDEKDRQEDEEGKEDEESEEEEHQVRTRSRSHKGGGGDSRRAQLPDRWTRRGQGLMWVREHRTARVDMFRPNDAVRGPNRVSSLWGLRKTEGTMQDGRKFVVTDDWTSEDKEDKNSIRQPWTGTTTFVMRTPENRLGRMCKTEEKLRGQD